MSRRLNATFFLTIIQDYVIFYFFPLLIIHKNYIQCNEKLVALNKVEFISQPMWNGKLHQTTINNYKILDVFQPRIYRLQTPPPSEVAILTHKMRNVLKLKIGVKFHITSYRVWALWASVCSFEMSFVKMSGNVNSRPGWQLS